MTHSTLRKPTRPYLAAFFNALHWNMRHVPIAKGDTDAMLAWVRTSAQHARCCESDCIANAAWLRVRAVETGLNFNRHQRRRMPRHWLGCYATTLDNPAEVAVRRMAIRLGGAS